MAFVFTAGMELLLDLGRERCCGELSRYSGGLVGSWAGSVYDLEAIFFDDGIGEDFFGDALELFLSFVAVPAVEIESEQEDYGQVCSSRRVAGRLDIGSYFSDFRPRQDLKRNHYYMHYLLTSVPTH